MPIAVAAVSGDIDVGFTGFTGAFYNLAGKDGLKVIAGTAREAPGFQNTAYVASKRAYDAGLRTLADLPGHSVGAKLDYPATRARLGSCGPGTLPEGLGADECPAALSASA